MKLQELTDEKLRQLYIDPILNHPEVAKGRSEMVTVIVNTLSLGRVRDERVCPYFFECEREFHSKCVGGYRSCTDYRMNLTGDILDGRIKLQREDLSKI